MGTLTERGNSSTLSTQLTTLAQSKSWTHIDWSLTLSQLMSTHSRGMKEEEDGVGTLDLQDGHIDSSLSNFLDYTRVETTWSSTQCQERTGMLTTDMERQLITSNS